MNISIRTFVAPAIAAVSLVACGILGPNHDWQLRPASVLVTPEGPAVAAPATARAKVPFVVEITTTGGGCERKGTTEVEINQQTRTAEISPLDYTDAAAEVCTDILKTFKHTATVAFDTPGTATIRVFVGSDNPTFARPEVTRTVQITP